MKKILAFTSILLFSCSEEKPMFNKVTVSFYNFNKEAKNRTVSKNIIEGSFNIYKENNDKAKIKDANSKFELTLNQKPASGILVDFDGRELTWDEKNNYKISNSMNGDTVIIRYFPTYLTDENVLKFGSEYKFHN